MAFTGISVVLWLLSVAALAGGQSVLYGWGQNNYGQLGMGKETSVYTPTAIKSFNTPIFNVLVAQNYVILLAQNGSAYGTGYDFYGQLANGVSGTTYTSPISCPALNSSLTISLSGTSCNAIYKTILYGWGNAAGYVLAGKSAGDYSQLSPATTSYEFNGQVENVASVISGLLVTLANGSVFAAGVNTNGNLGIGNTNPQYSFVEVPFWNNVLMKFFPSQSAHACALATNYSLYCWGNNANGQLGVGNTIQYNTPTRVAFFDEGEYYIYQVSYGGDFTIVLTCGGVLFAFGANNYGQLDIGAPDTNAHATPVEMLINNAIADFEFVNVVTGINQVFARAENGTWYISGAGGSGALGTGNSNNVYQLEINVNLAPTTINRIATSSQSTNFFGWYDPNANENLFLGCPVLVDECTTGAANCDISATCEDTERAYTCTCRDGFTGNGFANDTTINTVVGTVIGNGCSSIYSCTNTSDLCVGNATCNKANGQCVCNIGFQGDGNVYGVGCAPINECSGSPCAPNAYCTYTGPGTYVCDCDEDFYGDAYNSGCRLYCAPGNYSTNLITCEQCPPGSYTNTPTATYCTPCPGGTYNDSNANTDESYCTQCGVGGYSELGAAYCSLCVHGYTNDPLVLHTDNTTCTACPIGTYGYNGTCYPCNPGGFSNTTAAKQCLLCAPGYFNTASGATMCNQCTAGSRSSCNSTSCTLCGAGYYSYAGSSDCLKCPAGTSTNGLTGQSSCTNCTAGYYTSQNAASTCSPCPPGTYSSTSGTTNCNQCTPGTFAASSGSISCTACQTGTVASGAGSVGCSNCNSGYQSSNGISCTPCTAGYYLSGGTCTPCPAGTFVAVTGAATSCYACSAGTYASSTGSTYCSKCPLNTYTNTTTGFANCAACPTGTTSSGGAYLCTAA
jgi:alpha-tubulin suppressor-like RCC1 family protein